MPIDISGRPAARLVSHYDTAAPVAPRPRLYDFDLISSD
jgi:hypothetical protein